MVVRCITAVLLLLALVSISDGLEEALQSLEPHRAEKLHPAKKPRLQEFYDHAEYKSQSSGREDSTEHKSATPLPELLSTFRPTELRESDADMASEKKPSVPKKGVAYKKPSVVPKKEVHFASSVVAKKGADPESSTPSVSPRKGVELSLGEPSLSPGIPGYDSSSVSDKGVGKTNVSILSSGNMIHKNGLTKINGIGNEVGSEKGNPSNVPTPQLVQEKGKLNTTLWNPSQPSSDSSVTMVAVVPSVKVSNTGHLKPTTADDTSASSNQ